MNNYDPTDFPIPEWAERRSSGAYMEVGAQLCTRDGRRLGNAYVDDISHHVQLGPLAHVITDMGSTFRMTLEELAEGFWPPAYIMNVSEARIRLRRRQIKDGIHDDQE